MRPALVVLGGLPGVGKTTLARLVARRLGAVHLRIDTIEQALRDGGQELRGPEGYLVAYGVAVDNLRLGMPVVADSVNPIPITRHAWRGVAEVAGAIFVQVQITCSDPVEHRRRVEGRVTDVPGLRLPTWAQVLAREVAPWPEADVRIDTATASADTCATQIVQTCVALGVVPRSPESSAEVG